jgi:hypothetical protein
MSALSSLSSFSFPSFLFLFFFFSPLKADYVFVPGQFYCGVTVLENRAVRGYDRLLSTGLEE